MTIEIILVQFILGLILFFVINWVGKHSYSVGYVSLSIFARYDEAPAFNFLLRVLSPVIYLFISASILYFFEFDKYTYNFFMVSFYYILIRFLVNIVTERNILINWYKQVMYWCFILFFFPYYSYKKIIITKEHLLPDFSNLSNELWIIIFVFLYQIINKIELSHTATDRRKENYVKSVFTYYNKKYGFLIGQLNNSKLVSLSYAILIHENFNTPKIIRLLENISFIITKKPHTLGIMQVRTNRLINDRESVEMGISKIRSDYEYLMTNPDGKYDKESSWVDNRIMTDLIFKFNGGSEYGDSVGELQELIQQRFFTKSKDTLLQNLK